MVTLSHGDFLFLIITGRRAGWSIISNHLLTFWGFCDILGALPLSMYHHSPIARLTGRFSVLFRQDAFFLQVGQQVGLG